MDLETLKRYSKGELTTKQFLAVHHDAGELLDLLQQHLRANEFVSSVQDWPEPRPRRLGREYFALKSMMLFTPLVIVVGTALFFVNPIASFLVVLGWLTLTSLVGFGMLWLTVRKQRSKQGRSVLVATNRRLLRIWLDGSEEVQGWWLGENEVSELLEPVSETIKFLIELDLGKPSLN